MGLARMERRGSKQKASVQVAQVHSQAHTFTNALGTGGTVVKVVDTGPSLLVLYE
jgi:hypothetical protein